MLEVDTRLLWSMTPILTEEPVSETSHCSGFMGLQHVVAQLAEHRLVTMGIEKHFVILLPLKVLEVLLIMLVQIQKVLCQMFGGLEILDVDVGVGRSHLVQTFLGRVHNWNDRGTKWPQQLL